MCNCSDHLEWKLVLNATFYLLPLHLVEAPTSNSLIETIGTVKVLWHWGRIVVWMLMQNSTVYVNKCNATITYAFKWDLYQSVFRLSVSLVVTIRKKMMHPARYEPSGTYLSCCSISLGLQTDLVIGTDRARFCCFVCLCGSLLSICVRWNVELDDFHVC